jgi:molybdopterin synthase sulfur carrier subunit
VETKLIYFAWVRERIGVPEERLTLPEDVRTVKDLLAFLKGRGEGYEQALRVPQAIRVAIDQEHVGHDAAIAGAREIALFPPMTGG